jgi:putative lipoic acid-binding regulatory protein
MSNQYILNQRKPDISYPCVWEYKVIGSDKDKLEAALYAACAPSVPSVSVSNVSAKGTYFSLDAVIEVRDEEMRLSIFKFLQNSPDVKVVI